MVAFVCFAVFGEPSRTVGLSDFQQPLLFFGGESWKPIYMQVPNLGDVEYGYQCADHNGWIQLDGRAKSTLTVTQQTVATALGIGSNLSNLSDKTIVGVGGTKALNATGGNSTITIAQNQLPNVTLSTTTDGAHTHSYTNQNVTLDKVALNILGATFVKNNNRCNCRH